MTLQICTTATTAGKLRSVAQIGQQAPGAPSSTFFSSFNTPVIDNHGRVAFRAFVGGPGVGTTVQGIWLGQSTQDSDLIVLAGEQASGVPDGVTYGPGIRSPTLSGDGEIAFSASLTSNVQGFSGVRGLWRRDGDSNNRLVAGIGLPAQQTNNNEVFRYFDSSVPVAGGRVAFIGTTEGPNVTDENDMGIWREQSQGLSLVIREGAQLAGAPVGVTPGDFRDLSINKAGNVAFHGFLTGSGVDTSSHFGVWLEGNQGIELVARSGEQAPGASLGVSFLGFDSTVLNSAGEVAFQSFVGRFPGNSSATGIWVSDGRRLSLVALEGSQAAGANPGLIYSSVGDPLLNDSRQVAFAGVTQGTGVNPTNDEFLWSGSDGDLVVVAREGGQAPGVDLGVAFAGGFTAISLNALGQTAFTSQLTGPGVDDTNDMGIWAENLAGELKLIAREGDQVDISDDPTTEQLRTIRSLSLASQTDIQTEPSTGLNDRGEIAFLATFIDGTGQGVFISSVVAVPEPSGATLLLIAIAVSSPLLRRGNLASYR
ncbi:DUF7453 family protein [Adhaeretor mobilis]|uniref:DUF7453 family protein n=1 Tax=Adhaeretor mobilis TaxID=1930276 RepID=UPI001C54F26A|nr:choice-of-anchor tandem repeat NxxGxxAF-containing protein [Adhaeretor mobilis]